MRSMAISIRLYKVRCIQLRSIRDLTSAKELVIVQALNEKMKTVDKEISKIMDIIAELDW